MRPAARIAAAIEILDTILNRHQPTSLALADWGKSHRFAGSADRNAIGSLVYDALRKRLSLAWAMGSETPRALALGAALKTFMMTPEVLVAECNGKDHAPEKLSEQEQVGLVRSEAEAPDFIRANIPEWLWTSFHKTFGPRAVEEGRHLAERAPTDLRINTLKVVREKVLKALAEFNVRPTPFSPIGVRVPIAIGTARTPNLEAEAAFQAGWFEIQDEGSQVAALLADVGPQMQILDLCAGSGGKTLALAGQMQNKGQIYAYDKDRLRLKPIFSRIQRAGVRNVQVLKGGDQNALQALGQKFDRVIVDAPCSGTGVWRRRPESKWRLKAKSLEERTLEQEKVLATASQLVKPGGRIVYITCSLLPQENSLQIEKFLSQNRPFSLIPYEKIWKERLPDTLPQSALNTPLTLQLTPASHGTDGFYVAILQRSVS
ncbi:MAG: RsmB/NOP family class I SAM-dependent RNA methyltransferase [Hyphomicrobium sp.]